MSQGLNILPKKLSGSHVAFGLSPFLEWNRAEGRLEIVSRSMRSSILRVYGFEDMRSLKLLSSRHTPTSSIAFFHDPPRKAMNSLQKPFLFIATSQPHNKGLSIEIWKCGEFSAQLLSLWNLHWHLCSEFILRWSLVGLDGIHKAISGRCTRRKRHWKFPFYDDWSGERWKFSTSR